MIAIVGGGIAGLAAAYESPSGGPFTLFEASTGWAGSFGPNTWRFTIEAGADSMLAQKRAALELCAELALESKLISPSDPKTAFVLHRGALHALPSPSMLGIPGTWKGLAGYSLLTPAARARIALEPFIPVRRAEDDESIASFFRRRFGHESVDRVAQPLLGGIHAGSIERLSLPSLFPRLAEAERSRSRVLRWIRSTARRSGGAAFAHSRPAWASSSTHHARLPAQSLRCGRLS